jgi:hypothetical protein
MTGKFRVILSSWVGFPDLANENSRYPVKIEFQKNNK